LTSYGNPFYDYMIRQKRKNGIRCITVVDKSVKNLHFNQYLSYKKMAKGWRDNIRNKEGFTNRFIEEPFKLLNKKLECKKL